MKQIFLVLALIYFASCEDRDGPAHNVEIRPSDYGTCEDYYVYNSSNSDWLDDPDMSVAQKIRNILINAVLLDSSKMEQCIQDVLDYLEIKL